MGNNQAFCIVVVLMAFYALFANKLMAEADDQDRKVHIVYLGEKQYEDSKLTTESHHELLTSVLESKEKSSESMVYSYRHGFSGFAAKLTKSQAQRLAEMPGVVRVVRNSIYKMQTTRSWDFLGLSSSPSSNFNNLLHRGKMGDDIIIGVIDSGIWPESEAFSDKGMGPVPSRWKGACELGEQFNSTNCNRKVIGARWYMKGLVADFGKEALANEYLSSRDVNGHGTHVASTAAGSFVRNVSYHGYATGTLRGGAPLARLAIYKAMWTEKGLGASADILKAIDEAIHDGVDVLSMSIGSQVPLFPEFSKHELAIGSFHAIARGICVVCAAGNDGPYKQTVENVAPWILTVAASTIDRAFLSLITLGDNTTYLGQSSFSAKKDIINELKYSETDQDEGLSSCKRILRHDTSVSGKVVLCFTELANADAVEIVVAMAKTMNVSGLIIAGQHDDISSPWDEDFPCIIVDLDVGTKIFYYTLSNSNPVVKLSHARTVIGNSISTKVASFSSRGPNSASPAILKPDIAAPGSNILAAISPHNVDNDKGFAMLSGTSMATPHISGIVALLRSVHPDWSPAAIKSALITTARDKDRLGGPIVAEGSPPKVANPFDYGGGVVNPNAAADPGLIYDLSTEDYIYYYLCAMGYKGSDISHITQQKTECPLQRHSVLDLNLPTITVPELRNSTTVTRTVTNVGNLTSIYRAVIEAPSGFKVSVQPRVLAFNSTVRKISFKVTIATTLNGNYGYSFGTLIWTDGLHLVKTPLSLQTHFL